MTRAQVDAVVEIIKKRFPNLSVKETIDLVMDILEAVDRVTVVSNTSGDSA